MNDLRYVEAALRKNEMLDREHESFNVPSESDPYTLLEEYAEDLGVELPDFVDEEVEEGLRNRDSEYLQHFRDALDEMSFRYTKGEEV